MGDIIRNVKIVGIRDGKPISRRRTIKALFDTGATVSVIGTDLARRLRGDIIPSGDTIEGRYLDVMPVEVKVLAADCGARRKPVIVDDDLMSRAGGGVDMILGSDYMQRTRMAILMSMDRTDEGVACRRGKPPKRRARR